VEYGKRYAEHSASALHRQGRLIDYMEALGFPVSKRRHFAISSIPIGKAL
jgi:hypothetical protein